MHSTTFKRDTELPQVYGSDLSKIGMQPRHLGVKSCGALVAHGGPAPRHEKIICSRFLFKYPKFRERHVREAVLLVHHYRYQSHGDIARKCGRNATLTKM